MCFASVKANRKAADPCGACGAGLDVGTARVGGSHGGRLWRSLSVCVPHWLSVALLCFLCEHAVGVLLAELPDEAVE